MLNLTRRSWLMCLLGCTALALSGLGVHAQTLNGSRLNQRQFNNVAALSSLYGSIGSFGLNPSLGLSSLATLSANPYGAGGLANSAYGGAGQNPYGSYYEDPNGAYLRGLGQVTDSQGRFMVNQQQAYLLREQFRSQKIATDRKAFDEYLYERLKTPTAEEERRRLQTQAVQRALNHPPVTEIWSGRALNDLLEDLQAQPTGTDSAAGSSQSISLDEEGLKHINVTKGAGNIGLLKNGGRFEWPVALAGSAHAPERDRLTALAQEALRQIEFNSRAEAGTIRQLTAGLDDLRGQLRNNGRNVSASEYIEAKKFLSDFDDAVTALRHADVGNSIAGQEVFKAKTVSELVRRMTEQGLHFAPAVAGDEGAYQTLHQRLVEYDVAAQTRTAAR